MSSPEGYGAPQESVKSPEQRKQVLAQQVRSLVTQGGRVESQNEFEAVVATGQPVNHTLHLIITVLTCVVLWGPVWLILTLTGGVKRSLVAVDEYGYVTVQKITTS